MHRILAITLMVSTAGCAMQTAEPVTSAAPAAVSVEPEAAAYDVEAQLAEFARIDMAPDTSFLTDEEREVVNLLIEAADLMNEIYLRQYFADNPALRSQIAASNAPNRDTLLAMFDLHFGAWDQLDEFHPFFGNTVLPDGAGFYPVDLTREDYDAYLAAHPDQREALNSPYTMIRRSGDELVAIPYSEAYAEWLVPAARLLERAAERTSNASLRRFLTLRAQAFASNDYYESELAWMDIEGTSIEPVIGPYEVYTDRLMGQKTAFEAFITLRQPEQSAALDRFKALLPDMEANLPVPERYRDANRPFNSPIIVAEQVSGGGDNSAAVQTIAFNLPNDERVRQLRGAKKVVLSNVLEAKYERILAPMAQLVLPPEQAALASREYMTLETLFHELSHSLGPGIITIDGRETTVNAELRDLYSASEEAKADVMGVWSILYLMGRGEMPIADREELLATYFVGIFRAVRFGIDEAHGRGAALQYGYLLERGAFAWDTETRRYRVDYERLEAGIASLVAELVTRQGDGDYAGMDAFFGRYARLDDAARAALATMSDIPTDIRPIYPDRI